MNQAELQLYVVESSPPHPFALPESKRAQPPIQWERYIMGLIRDGRPDLLQSELDSLRKLDSGLVVGQLSKNPLRQAQYLAVGMITMATRAAIEGGVRQSAAFAASDVAILRLDCMTQPGEVLDLMLDYNMEMAKCTVHAKERSSHPAVRRMQYYVQQHLYERVTLQQLGEAAGLVPDHAGKLFRRETGQTPMQYVRSAKLEEAKRLLILRQGTPQQVADSLCFCNHSYFIRCFEQHTGYTPARYCAQYSAVEE